LVTNPVTHLKAQQSVPLSVAQVAQSTATPKTRTNTKISGLQPLSKKPQGLKPCGFFVSEKLCHSEISDYSPPPEGLAFKLASSLPALFPVYFDERLQEVHTHLIDPCQPPKSASAGF
jgi:hypothetical protein